MPPTARKRAKVTSTTAAAPPLVVEAVARLRAQLAYLDQQLSSADTPAELERELGTLSDRLRTYEAAAGAAAPAGDVERAVVGTGWSDELDQKGTQLWNRSTALKHAHLVDEHSDPAWLAVVANCASASSPLPPPPSAPTSELTCRSSLFQCASSPTASSVSAPSSLCPSPVRRPSSLTQYARARRR